MISTNGKFQSVALLLVRLAFGVRLIYGTADNVFSWDRMLEFEAFLAHNGFPLPLFSAVTSVYLQFLAGICWVIGFKTRTAALIMAANFTIALVGAHLLQGDSYLNYAPALHLLVISLLIWAMGPGQYSLDQWKGQPK